MDIVVALVAAAVASAFLFGAALWFSRRAKRAEAALAEKTRDCANLAEVLDGAAEAIVVIDEQAAIWRFNRAAERMFGYGAEEMIGSSLERLMTERARASHADYLAKHGVTAMVEAARQRTVHKGVRKRGDTFSFELAMSEWRDGARRMFTGVLRDVTERELAADAAGEANARAAALFEAMDEPLVVFGVGAGGDFVLDQINRAAEEATGWSRYAVTGSAPEALVPGDSRALKRVLLECLSSRGPISADLQLKFGDAPAQVRVTLTPLPDKSGEIDRLLGRLHLGEATARG